MIELALTVLLPAASAASPHQSFGLDTALSFSAVRDDLLVPYAFSGGRFELGARYRGVWVDHARRLRGLGPSEDGSCTCFRHETW